MKNIKGITLIVLVVTIVVLLIISGVAISMITGYNGLFGMANSSASKYNQNSLSEQQRLQEIYSQLLLADSDSTTLENIDMTTLNALIEQKVNTIIQPLQQEIDRLKNSSAFLPTGTIVALMGKTAPAGYLACDGGEYEISAYQALADYFEAQFGNKQYFGGTGTTFKVPNLCGEFLRGAGNNIHTQTIAGVSVREGDAGDVGTHQGSTVLRNIYHYDKSSYTQAIFYSNSSSGLNSNLDLSNRDRTFVTSTHSRAISADSNAVKSNTSNAVGFSIRPTNTAVLYCIKV